MVTRSIRQMLALTLGTVLLLSACGTQDQTTQDTQSGSLTCSSWAEYSNFWALAQQTYPDIDLSFSNYGGANRTGYSWAQMRGDDIPDLFITSQFLEEDLAKEHLVDLSNYDFVNGFSTSILDQVSVDGGIYLLPVSNAMYGIYYNKSLMTERGWEVPTNFAQLEALCDQLRAEGITPGIADARLTGGPFAAVFNLAKTSWLTTPEGVTWERDFLAGTATAAGTWEDTMDYVQKYIDLGMFTTDPEDRRVTTLIEEYLGGRKAMFCAATYAVSDTTIPGSTDELGLMPYLSEDGSKNIYMYSPTSYIGISNRLTEPGNEQKLENAVKLLSLLYSPEGQAAFITDQTPCYLSVLDGNAVPEDSLIYDAQQALWDGRAFPMTYAHWENVLSDMGQAYKEWFQGVNGMDGPKCIAQMDALQSSYLDTQEAIYFCESTADFTMEETAVLIGKALGSAVGADAAMIPFVEAYSDNAPLESGISGKLYQGKINAEVSNSLVPSKDGEYALLTMTGAQAKELAAAGFTIEDSTYPYVLVTKGGGELEDDQTYQIAFLMESYTQEAGQNYTAQTQTGSLRDFLRNWLTEQKTVAPDGNPWT